MDISSNYSVQGNTHISPVKTGRKFANLAPLGKDTVSFKKEVKENPAQTAFTEILFGNVDRAKEIFMSSSPNATEEDFQKFYIDSMIEYGSSPEILTKGEDIEFDEVKPDKKGRMNSFYKNGILLREAPVINSPEDLKGHFEIKDYVGHDDSSKSYIEIGRIYSGGELMGTETVFREDKYNLKYKSVFNVLSNGKMPRHDTTFDERAFILRDKIDEIAPKYTENCELKKPDADTRLPKYLYHITTRDNYEKMLISGKMKTNAVSDTLQGIYCIDGENFKNQWGEHEAWKGNLKENLIFKQIVRKKESGDIVVLRIPTEKIDDKKIKTRCQEDYFYSQDIGYYGSLLGTKEPKCVSEGYDWATGIKNFYDDKSLEFIISEDIDIDNVDVVYSGTPRSGNIDEIVNCMQPRPEETEKSKKTSGFSFFKNLFK